VSSTAAASPETEIAPQARELVRGLSLRDAIALVLTVIGTGVFLKTATMAQLVGSPSNVLLAWVAAGLLSLAGALTYAELGAMMPEAGGEYVFLREAYGDLPAFLFGWSSVMLIASGGLAAVSTALASFLASFVPLNAVWVTHDFNLLGQVVHWRFGIQQIVAVAMILLFAGVNARGIRLGSRVQWVATVAKLGGIAIIVFGAFLLSRTGSWEHLKTSEVARIAPAGVGAFGAALITNLAYFYALPFSEILTTNSTAYRDALPVAAAAAQTFSSYGAQIVSIAFAIAAIGALNAITMMNARVPFAMARDGLFFRQLGNLSPTSLVPVNAIWFLGIWASVLALAGTFDQITTAAIFGVWLFTALVGSSLFILRNKLPAAPRRYRTPGYPVVPALFVLVALWLVVNTVTAYPVESVAGLVLMALGLPFYFLFRASGWLARARMKDRPH